MTGRALAVWVVLLGCAIVNGALREGVLTPAWGPGRGHVVSTFVLCAAIVAVTAATIGWMAPADRAAAWRIGAGWVLLTLAFEFLAGHYLFERPWPVLLADYDVFAGRVWILVLLTTAAAPALTTS